MYYLTSALGHLSNARWCIYDKLQFWICKEYMLLPRTHWYHSCDGTVVSYSKANFFESPAEASRSPVDVETVDDKSCVSPMQQSMAMHNKSALGIKNVMTTGKIHNNNQMKHIAYTIVS